MFAVISDMNRLFIYIGAGVVVAVIVLGFIWFFMGRSASTAQNLPPSDSFGVPGNTGGVANTPDSNSTQTIVTSSGATTKVFQITSLPAASATLIQTLHPTTTIARYIRQEDGHVFDLPLDVPGAVPRVVSNITIPGGERAVWVESGKAAVMQYLDGATVKTVYLGFSASSTASTTLPTRLQFLPDAIIDLAASPDGKNVAYLLKTSAGTDGYIAKDDGTASKKVFSLPLSQVQLSWPAQDTLLAQTNYASGVSGLIFSIDAKSGAVTPLVYALGLTASADRTFSKIIYQSTQAGTDVRSTYVHDVKTSTDRALSFDPYPEKCIWSALATSTVYCASPITYTTPGYLDAWYQGAAAVADSLLVFHVATGQSSIIASPGGADGGVPSNVLEMALSPDEHYLLFIQKGDRSVWGIRLTQ